VWGLLVKTFSKRYDPRPDPVPPAIEWQSTKPYGSKGSGERDHTEEEGGQENE